MLGNLTSQLGKKNIISSTFDLDRYHEGSRRVHV